MQWMSLQLFLATHCAGRRPHSLIYCACGNRKNSRLRWRISMEKSNATIGIVHSHSVHDETSVREPTGTADGVKSDQPATPRLQSGKEADIALPPGSQSQAKSAVRAPSS